MGDGHGICVIISQTMNYLFFPIDIIFIYSELNFTKLIEFKKKITQLVIDINTI